MVDEYSLIEKRFCVEWNVVIPMSHLQLSFKSPGFVFENSQYFFTLSKSGVGGIYNLVLDRADPSELYNKKFKLLIYFVKSDESVSRFLINDTTETFPVVHKGILANHFSQHCNKHSTPPSYSYEGRIVCFIESFVPCDVHSNEETDSSTGPVRRVSTKSQTIDSDFSSHLEHLSQDFANLLKSGTLPDVRIRCGGRVFPAHRHVLVARSEVFAAMFANEMSESRTGSVDVEDLDERVFDVFLKYLYSGRVPEVPDDVVPDLYAAADRYAVHRLQTWCRDRMTSTLTERRCVGVLIVADAHSDAILKKAVISFMCSHELVFESDDWRTFSRKPSALVTEVYQTFVECKVEES